MLVCMGLEGCSEGDGKGGQELDGGVEDRVIEDGGHVGVGVLAVYGREGEGCRRCGAVMRREKFMNRSSFYCPRCQPRPRIRRNGIPGR